MRRYLSRFVAVLLLASFTVLPAYGAAPRRDDSQQDFLTRIVKIVKRVVHALEDISVNVPKP